MPQALKWLKAVGANIDLPTYPDIDGFCTFSTPLHLALGGGQFALAKVLIQLGCKVDGQRTLKGRTPALTLACEPFTKKGESKEQPLEVNAPQTNKTLIADLCLLLMAITPSRPVNT